MVAGSFTVDGLGGPFVSAIEGDYHNVVGLSLPLLRRMLIEVGIPWPALWQTSTPFTYDESVAATYDETRGGATRAQAAAEAVDSLLPKGGRVLELAVGTGIVGAELVARATSCTVSTCPPRCCATRGSGCPVTSRPPTRPTLPIADRRCDAVVAIWLLHLLDDSEPVIAEVARVLRPGGVFITTTEKSDAGRYADGRVPDESRAQDALTHLVAQRRPPRPHPRRRDHLPRPTPHHRPDPRSTRWSASAVL